MNKDGNYGLQFFDPDPDEGDIQEEDDEYEAQACPRNCCDTDCECDDCLRCSLEAMKDEEELVVGASAA